MVEFDGDLINEVIAREAKLNFADHVQEFNACVFNRAFRSATRIQGVIITAMAITIEKLEKRNALMEADYRTRNKK